MSQSVVWGDGVLDAGFSQIPNLLLDHQHDLGITNDELALIIHVIRYKHSAQDPYPRNATIAERMQCSERTLQRYIASLRDKKLLRREQVNDWSHTWDFSLLLNKLRRLSPPGDKNGTHPPAESSPPPGAKTVTQNNTSSMNSTREQGVSAGAHAHTRGEDQADSEPSDSPLSSDEDYKTEQRKPKEATTPQRDFLKALLAERDVPGPLAETVTISLSNGITKQKADELIDRLQTYAKNGRAQTRTEEPEDEVVTVIIENEAWEKTPLKMGRRRYERLLREIKRNQDCGSSCPALVHINGRSTYVYSAEMETEEVAS